MAILDVMLGGGVVMWPILLCLLLTIGVMMDRWLVFRRGSIDTTQFLPKLKSLYRHGDISAVLSYCSQKDAPIARIVRRGVLKHKLGPDSVREAVEGAAHEEMFGFERRLSLLASVSGFAPMLGFLGSIIGLMTTFRAIEIKGAIAVPGELAGGIWQALLPTAFGLIVGMIALVAYNAFAARVRKVVREMESASNEFLDLLDEPLTENGSTNGDGLHVALRPQAVETDPFQRKL
jgi:biopolymer transport protein ExbB